MQYAHPRIWSRTAQTLACALWGVIAVGGMLALSLYSGSSGAIGDPSLVWPENTTLERSSDRFTLVLFVHPRCPCSRASLEQLARIQSRCRNRLAIHIVFFSPARSSTDWARTGLWELAGRIPGVQVSVDPDGRTAAQFGARTSGHVAVYDAQGSMVFNGGITAGRGHEGDNIGTSAVIAIVRGESSVQQRTDVFGCAIHTGQSAPTLGTAADITTPCEGVPQ